jgi:hypothetical protein
VQVATLAATLNDEQDWRIYWDRLLPGVQPPSWAKRAPFLRLLAFRLPGPTVPVQKAFQKQLLEYIEAWMESGEQYLNFRESFPSLAEKINSSIRTTTVELFPGPDGDAVIGPVNGPAGIDAAVFLASWEFIDFVQNPLRIRLGKCLRCHRYYLSKNECKKKRFCSPRCGTNFLMKKARHRSSPDAIQD